MYELKSIEKTISAFTPSEIILDLDSNWDLEELKEILNQKDKKFFVFMSNQKSEINFSNCEEIFSRYESLSYSLLPLYSMKDSSLIITKSGSISANFEELQTSNYLTKLKKGTKNKNLKVINISEEINPFWQTLKEQKYIEYLKTDLKECTELLKNGQFISFKPAENTVNIELSNCSIEEKTEGNKISNGSDHIYRMYAFGKVLEEQVKIQEDSLEVNQYVSLARDANIVTPISSLIVLETDADYESNGIEKNVNTLGNASINDDGAVPEPHEWLMIIAGLLLLFFYCKKAKRQNT